MRPRLRSTGSIIWIDLCRCFREDLLAKRVQVGEEPTDADCPSERCLQAENSPRYMEEKNKPRKDELVGCRAPPGPRGTRNIAAYGQINKD